MTKSRSPVRGTCCLTILLFGGLGCTAQIVGDGKQSQDGGGLAPIAAGTGGTASAATPTLKPESEAQGQPV